MNQLANNVVPFNRLHARTAQSDQEISERWVRKELSGYPSSVVAQAVARANRLIRAGKCWSLSADQAVKWARCAATSGGNDAA